MKKSVLVATILVAVILALSIALSIKNVIAKKAISSGVKAMTGLKLSIGSVNVGIFKSAIGIKDLKLQNPGGFQDKFMVDMPEIYIDYDLRAFLNKKVHLEEVRLNLKELVVVRNAEGELNLNSLKVVKDTKTAPAKEEKPKEGEFLIDLLQLKIGKVIFKDYSQGKKPQTTEFNLNINERYENITDANKLVSLIITRALINTTVAKLADFDLKSLERKAGGLLKNVKESAKDILNKAKEEGEKAMEKLKDILPPEK